MSAYRIHAACTRTLVAELPGGQLDGLMRLSDGSRLGSSWEDEALYRVDPIGVVSAAREESETPADIGCDSSRGRVLIPGFAGNRVDLVPIR
jgi:hypothetical protein